MKGLLDDTNTAIVPKRIKPPGKKPHRLAYIDGDEASMLRARGGGVAPGGGQIMRHGLPSFEEPGGAASDNANSNSEASTQDMGADPGADPSAGVDGGHNGPAGTDTNGDPGGEWLPNSTSRWDNSNRDARFRDANGYRMEYYEGMHGPPAAAAPRSSMTLQAATPVYTPRPEMQAPIQGVTPGGFAPGLEAMRAMFGPKPLPVQPTGPGGGQAPGSNVPMGAWQPPPVAPVQYPQEPILTGRGGNAAYYDQMQRLAPSQMPMGYFDALRQYRRW